MIKKYFPLLGFLVGALNMEAVVIPLILIGLLDLWDNELKIAAVICATLEIIYWYWFSGWLMNNTKKGEKVLTFFKDLFEFSEHKLYPKAKKTNVVGTITSWLKDQIDQFRPEKHEGHWIYEKIKEGMKDKRNVRSKAASFGRFLSGLLLVAVTAFPLPIIAGFLWIPALVACRSANWHKGLIFLIIGNGIKNWIYASGYIAFLS